MSIGYGGIVRQFGDLMLDIVRRFVNVIPVRPARPSEKTWLTRFDDEGRRPMELRVSVQSVQQQAVEKLRTAILAGVFKPGDRLVEADLCRRTGVSRPSLREALRSLESEGLIIIVPNRGPQIPVLTWEQAEQIYQVRALLEGEAAALCARHGTRQHHEEMRAALTAFEKAVRNNDGAVRLSATAEFYRILQRGSGQVVIDDLLQRLVARVNFLRAQSMSQADRAKFSLREMRAIFQAVVDGDSRAARKAAELHVRNASAVLRTMFEIEAGANGLKEAG
jgi:GntR family transcriptional regulator, trigonelline degradation regulator